jgi:uncharacterized FlgJ-related protein
MLLILETLPKGSKFNQDYFLQSLPLALADKERCHSRKYKGTIFFVQMGNALPHTGAKITAEMER